MAVATRTLLALVRAWNPYRGKRVRCTDGQEERPLMKRLTRASLAALGLLGLLTTGQARAQFSYQRPQTSPFNTPAVSPYLNLTRGGNAAINYNTLVKPQIDTSRSLQQLQTQVGQNQQLLMAQLTERPGGIDPNVVLPFTGHPVQFMAYSHYFTTAGTRQGQGQAPALGGRR
jgi:hypothetical protein